MLVECSLIEEWENNVVCSCASWSNVVTLCLRMNFDILRIICVDCGLKVGECEVSFDLETKKRLVV